MRFRCAIVRLAIVCVAAVAVLHVSLLPLRAETPSASARVFNPIDLDNLRGVRGQVATVEGTIVRAGESKSKTVRYLNFTDNYRDSLALVFFVGKGGDAFSMERLHQWIGKKVRATGKVTEYGSNVQLEIVKWDQITELKKDAK